MDILSLDIETFSSNDLLKTGVYKYVLAPDFEIMLLAFKFNDSRKTLIDLMDLQLIPRWVEEALLSPDVLKTAYNAQFERVCFSRYFNKTLDPRQWQCTQVKAAMLGYPFGLGAAAEAMKIPQKKDPIGRQLIRKFSIPCKPTKKNGYRTRNYPEHFPEDWQLFGEYCLKDVDAETGILKHIDWFEIPEREKKLYVLDQEINDRGIKIDVPFVKNVIDLNNTIKDELTERAIELTGLDNPNSVSQLKKWLNTEIKPDEEITSLSKPIVKTLLTQTDDEDIKEVLKIRQELGKTSIKKYEAMIKCLCDDEKVRGLLQFYGANRTGRWAGRLIQVQNLPKNDMPDLDLAREIVASGDLELLRMLYSNTSDVFSQLIRTAFVTEGEGLLVSDFSAIEARVIAWLAGERWRLDVFRSHGKIYEASAAQMFGVPLESVMKGGSNYYLRAKGKIAELALGYQGGPNALIKMGAIEMGVADYAIKVAEEKYKRGEFFVKGKKRPTWEAIREQAILKEFLKLVKMWRNANRKIVDFWQDMNDAALEAMDGHTARLDCNITFKRRKNLLAMTLPSGRNLYYVDPTVGPGKYGPQISYWGLNDKKKWSKISAYGGKWVENCVQGVARDCLATAMLRLDKVGYKINMSVHDEAVADKLAGQTSKQMDHIMSIPIPWAKGLPLRGDGYETAFYKKLD